MKKLLTTAALSGVLILGGATAALATHAEIPAEAPGVVAMGAKVQIDGSVRVRGTINKDTVKDSANSTFYDGRARLGVTARVNEQVMGYLQLETGHDYLDYWTFGGTSDANLARGGSKAGNTMEILQAWVHYSPGNWGVKAGHMPLALGNNLFFDHTGSGDDAIVFWGSMDGFVWNLLTIKLQENLKNDNSDDLDAYVVNLTKSFDSFKANVNYTLLKGGSSSDPLDTITWLGMEMSNLGVALDYKMGDLSLKGDGEFQFGTFAESGAVKSDANGWAMLLSGDYKIGDGSLGLLFGYGSGDAPDDTDLDLDTFLPFLTDTAYQVIIPGYRQAVPGAVTAAGGQYGGLSNLTLYQLNGSLATNCPLTGKPLSVRAALSYMQTSEDIDIDSTVAGIQSEDNLGVEADVVASWQLSAGLTYKVELAYLWAGDAWKTSVGDDPDDAFFIRHGLEVAW